MRDRADTPSVSPEQDIASNPMEACDCDPAYPDVRLPSPPPDLDCRQIGARRFRVLPSDPHNFDGDFNGIGVRVPSQSCIVNSILAISVLCALLPIAPIEPVSAQQEDERVSSCTEKLLVRAVSIGHDCGEFSSDLIAGHVIIQRSCFLR